jgi:hypothetical protein
VQRWARLATKIGMGQGSSKDAKERAAVSGTMMMGDTQESGLRQGK